MLARLVRGIDEFKYETRADLLEAFTGEGFARQADRKIKRPPASETSTVAAREQDDIGLAPGEINDIICDFFTEVVVPKRLVIFNEQVWGYDEGINAYVLQSPKKAEKCVQNLVVMWRTTNADLDPKEISAIKLGVYEKLPFVTSENILLTTREPKEHWVAVRNGIVDIQAYLQDRPPLLPKNPDFFTTSAIDCNYDPSAEAPLYQMVTSEVLSEEQKRHFEEFVGYAIGKTRIKQNGLLIIGPKDSGKSTITEPVVDLFNSQAVCSVQPSEMRPGSFALQSFVGAQLNRLTEVASKRMCPTTVKQILACEDITINPKGIAQFRYLTRAAHLWACNPGNFEYRDEAFDSRLSIIVLVKSIKTKDPRFQQAGFWKQSGEMPGIFNIGLRGLKRLHERGYKFIEPDSSLQMKKALLLESDPMAAFIHDNLEYEKDAVTYSDDAYIAYCEEIKYTAHRAKTKRQFSDAVMREFSGRGVVSINTRRNGVQVRAYKNLSFRSSTDTPPPEAQEIAEENKIVLREIGRLVDALKRETREYEWDQEAIRFLLHEADETLKRACTV
jgi:hypothetical protein